MTSSLPAAAKHLLPIIVTICMRDSDAFAIQALVSICEAHGATFERKTTVPLLLVIFAVFVSSNLEVNINERMKPILRLGGGPYKHKIGVGELNKEEIMALMIGAMARLDNPAFPLRLPSELGGARSTSNINMLFEFS
ncbi:hypothetical protein B0H19DRAFT_1259425 [Mycena capillaripes]|nr:hypothetical protein B0H19DRAFT_1259425 [Mycena capillaripes]